MPKNHALFRGVDGFYFTDGACSNNPGPGGWAFLFCDLTKDLVFESGGAESSTTNNRMEMRAAIEAISHFITLPSQFRALLVLDSDYVRKGITEWLPGWKAKGWKKSDGEQVLNQDLWMILDGLLTDSIRNRLSFHLVRGHEGVSGNERVDEIAVAFSLNQKVALYQAPLSSYSVKLAEGLDRQPQEAGQKSKKKSSSKKGIYLSLVKGVLERHETWAECEARVKGTSGAKFKKVSSAEEEAQTLKAWGL